MRYVMILSLLIGSMFLTACNNGVPWEVTPRDACSWVEEIRFTQETKTWLETLDWPSQAFEDFNQIGDHNELVKEFC